MSGERMLRAAVAKGHVVVVAGAGVSLAASGSPVAGWKGLLEHGITWVREHVPPLDPEWEQRNSMVLGSNDPDDWIHVATQIRNALKQNFGTWLQDAFGDVSASNTEILDAIVGLGLPIATTNYDLLFERAHGLDAVTWTAPGEMSAVLQGEPRPSGRTGVAHLHGVYNQRNTVVFDARSYEDVCRNAAVQEVQKAVALARSLLFVGFRKGLEDPNIGRLIDWLQEQGAWNEKPHFALCLRGEEEYFGTRLRLIPVVYGDSYDALPGFLRSLVKSSVVELAVAPVPEKAPPPPPAAAPATPWRTAAAPVVWAALTVGRALWVLTPEAEVVVRTGTARAKTSLGELCGADVVGLAVVGDGSLVVALTARALHVWIVNVDGSLTVWADPFPVEGGWRAIERLRDVGGSGAAIDVSLAGETRATFRVERSGVLRRTANGAASSAIDVATGAAVSLGAELVDSPTGAQLVLRRTDGHVTSERVIPVGARVTRISVARPLRARTAPFAAVAELGGTLAAWRWDDLPGEESNTRELVKNR